MRSLNSTLLLVFVFFVSITSVSAAATLNDLDAIAMKAPNAASFLASASLQEEYYQAAAEYYGGQSLFPRKSYYAILSQFAYLLKTNPEIANRAWEPTNIGKSYSVSSELPTSGYTLMQLPWEKYISQLKMDLSKQVGDLETKSESERDKFISDTVQSIKNKIAAHETQSASLKKSDRQAEQGKFYQGLRSDPHLKQIASFYILKWLNLPKTQEVFESGNSDLILSYLKEAKEQPKKIFESSAADMDTIASIGKSLLPDQSALIKDATLFKRTKVMGRDGELVDVEGGSKGVWNFISAPRRFHALFKGLPYAECVGGGENNLDSLTPERWATILLAETQFHYVEKRGKFLGWIQAVPITHKGKIYASLDIASPAFRQGVIQKNAEGDLVAGSMVGAWLEVAMKEKPERWEGFVVSQSDAISNSGALPAVRASPSYLLGSSFNTKTANHFDAAATNVLIRLLPRNGFAKKYGGSMIFDAAVPDAGELKILQPVGQTLFQILKRYYAENKVKEASAVLMKIRNSGWPAGQMMTLAGAGVLKLLADREITEFHNNTDPKEYFQKMIDLGLSLDEMKFAETLLLNTTDQIFKFDDLLLRSSLITDEASVIRALDFVRRGPSANYIQGREKLIRRWQEYLTEKFPNLDIESVIMFGSKSPSSEGFMAKELAVTAIDAGLKIIRSAAKYLPKSDVVPIYKQAFNRGNNNYKYQLATLANELNLPKSDIEQMHTDFYLALEMTATTVTDGTKYVVKALGELNPDNFRKVLYQAYMRGSANYKTGLIKILTSNEKYILQHFSPEESGRFLEQWTNILPEEFKKSLTTLKNTNIAPMCSSLFAS